MRNFEERKEEIFRRSEKRIEQRKRTVKRVVLTCVPLVLCLTAVSGYLALSGFGRSDMSAPESAFDPHYSVQDSVISNGSAVPESPDIPECMPPAQIISLQVQVGDEVYDCADNETIQKMEKLLPDTGMIADNDHTPESADEDQKYGKGDTLTVTLTYADGSEKVYWLEGNRFIGSDGIRELTPEQLAWLEDFKGEIQ